MSEGGRRLLLALAGDVMTGRGIDQVLTHSAPPDLHEPHVTHARRYVALAEAENGRIPAPVAFEYVWGDALGELASADPDLLILNLETAVTLRDDWWPTKGIHYRMHPSNVPLLSAAGVDLCVLANNHVLDWGRAGLSDTLDALTSAGVATAGAGPDSASARRPARLGPPGSPVRIHAWATPSAGVPRSWAAGADGPGVNLLPTVDAAAAERVVAEIGARRDGERVVVSVHWGGNWGYDVPDGHRAFAHRLIDAGAADVVFGHSSHHPKGIEVYRDRLILYGAGDLLNDYEGIGGHREYRGELSLLYFPELEGSGALRSLRMVPFRIRRFRLERASAADARWLAERLDRESQAFGVRVTVDPDGRLEARSHG